MKNNNLFMLFINEFLLLRIAGFFYNKISNKLLRNFDKLFEYMLIIS